MNATSFALILICSILIAGQIHRQNRIEAFQQVTSYQLYQSAVPSSLIVWPLLLFLFSYLLAQFFKRQTAILASAVLCLQVCSILFSLFRRNKQLGPVPDNPQKLKDHMSGILPIAVLWSAYFVQVTHYSLPLDVTSSILGYLVHISLCYTVLLLLLPLLRKYISARVCGYLWMFPLIALPLYHLGLSKNAPMLTIHTPLYLTNYIVIIWAVGFVGVLLWYLLSHRHFQKKLLLKAKPVHDSETKQLWQEVLHLCNFKEPQPQLLRSPDIATPLSVGSYLFLPEKEYTKEELRLILYHELIHTGRHDVFTKLNLSILAAFFWFNPLMWIALRRITEDLELSCDETTLLCESDATRKRYADLLLRTAGSPLGFSTCLSSSAKSLRYRLKNTLKPIKKASGYVIAGLFCMMCLLFQGSVALAYDHGTGANYIFSSVTADSFSVSQMHRDPLIDSQGWLLEPAARFQCRDSDALYDYLSGMELYRMTGNYLPAKTYCTIWIDCQTPQGDIKIYIDNRSITVKKYGTEYALDLISEETYHHGGNIDWEYLFGLFEPYQYIPDTPEPVPVETEPKDPPPLPSHK